MDEKRFKGGNGTRKCSARRKCGSVILGAETPRDFFKGIAVLPDFAPPDQIE